MTPTAQQEPTPEAADYPSLEAVIRLLGAEARSWMPEIQQRIFPFLVKMLTGVVNDNGELMTPNDSRDFAYKMSVDLYATHVLNSTGTSIEMPDIATLVGRPDRKFVPAEKAE